MGNSGSKCRVAIRYSIVKFAFLYTCACHVCVRALRAVLAFGTSVWVFFVELVIGQLTSVVCYRRFHFHFVLAIVYVFLSRGCIGAFGVFR